MTWKQNESWGHRIWNHMTRERKPSHPAITISLHWYIAALVLIFVLFMSTPVEIDMEIGMKGELSVPSENVANNGTVNIEEGHISIHVKAPVYIAIPMLYRQMYR